MNKCVSLRAILYQMQEKVIPYKGSNEGKKEQVRGMFDTISSNYDSVNRVMTMRLDIQWRKNVVKQVAYSQPKKIIDIATGTADLAIELAKIPQAHITGVDLSEGMLAVGKEKVMKLGLSQQISLMLGDSERLDYETNFFDVATVSFGVRNFENLEKGLSEIHRVLTPNGRLVILETSVPENVILKQGYLFYTRYILPFIGKILGNNKTAYDYLSESALKFPYGKKFAQILTQVGFSQVKILPQTLGVATIYVADK